MELAQLLTEQLSLDAGDVARAHEAAKERSVTLAEALVDAEVVLEESLADIVARAVGSVVIDLDQGSLDLDTVTLLSSQVARTHLALPVSSDTSQRGLRVAFANPLDTEAIAAVEQTTGRSVTPLVATVSALRTAIEGVYQRAEARAQTGEGVRRPVELPREETRRMDPSMRAALAVDAMRTTPMARLEDEATIEQRVEAVVLSLIEAGVITRADYIRALGRLLGRRDR